MNKWVERMAVRGGSYKKSMFIESKALISSFHCNPDGVPQSLRSHQFLG